MERLMAEPLKPARGVDLAQVLPVTGVLAALGAAAVVLCVLYRRGRLPAAERAVAVVEARTGMPGWTAIPAAVSAISLITAGFGFYWDVAVHIDRGRDANPFGTPAHWPIVLGLCGLVLAGMLAVALDKDTDGGAALQLPGGLRCSLGAGLILLCGTISLLGFPLDDLWHNTFGQDVTLWSPTHIQMIGGASLTTLATWVLLEEGRRRSGRSGETPRSWRMIDAVRNASIAGSFLIGLSTLQDEFDMGVPQFNPIYHPVLIALAAGIALTAARVRNGRGAAVRAALFFLVVRGIWALVIGGALGMTTPHVPLYLAEALLVEGAALVVPPERGLRFALTSGLLIGTVGVAAEWAFGQVAFVLPWQPVIFPEAYLLALVAAVAGALLGTAAGGALQPSRPTRVRVGAPAVAAAFAAVLVVIGVALPVGAHTGYRADVTVTRAGAHEANLLVKLDPPSAADDVAWFNVTSWQGGDLVAGHGLRLTPMDRVARGVYRSHGPVPVDGDYKSLLRLATATTQQAVPVYLPEDPAIPAKGVPASPHFTRDFVPDVKILQREQVGGSDTLKHWAYGVLAFLALLWVGTLAYGLRRLGRAAARPTPVLRLRLPRRPERSFA
jgi:hypothetical protein